jgi:hypothetical protein
LSDVGKTQLCVLQPCLQPVLQVTTIMRHKVGDQMPAARLLVYFLRTDQWQTLRPVLHHDPRITLTVVGMTAAVGLGRFLMENCNAAVPPCASQDKLCSSKRRCSSPSCPAHFVVDFICKSLRTVAGRGSRLVLQPTTGGHLKAALLPDRFIILIKMRLHSRAKQLS